MSGPKRRRWLAVSAAVVVLLGVAALVGPRLFGPPIHYLSLGDSLAQGIQPARSPDSLGTGKGFADVLRARMARTRPRLRLENLGCLGETAASFLEGRSVCRPPEQAQVAVAEAFLRAHRNSTAFVTMALGSNDIWPCVERGPVDEGCVENALATAGRNLPLILARLRAAGGPGVQVVGIGTYDPYLAAKPPLDPATARSSVAAVERFNAALAALYRQAGNSFADVGPDFALAVPDQAAARLCQLTWTCASPPAKADVHPNDEGYAAMARSVEKQVKL